MRDNLPILICFQLIGFTSSCVSISAFNEEEESCKYLAYSSTYTRPGTMGRSYSAQSYPTLYVRDSWCLPTYVSLSEGVDWSRSTQATPRMSQTSQLLIEPSDSEVQGQEPTKVCQPTCCRFLPGYSAAAAWFCPPSLYVVTGVSLSLCPSVDFQMLSFVKSGGWCSLHLLVLQCFARKIRRKSKSFLVFILILDLK